MNFTQLTVRLKNLFNGLVVGFGLKEGRVEYATVCVKSDVTLNYMQGIPSGFNIIYIDGGIYFKVDKTI